MKNGRDTSSALGFFKHYLSSRQLMDDFHDGDLHELHTLKKHVRRCGHYTKLSNNVYFENLHSSLLLDFRVMQVELQLKDQVSL